MIRLRRVEPGQILSSRRQGADAEALSVAEDILRRIREGQESGYISLLRSHKSVRSGIQVIDDCCACSSVEERIHDRNGEGRAKRPRRGNLEVRPVRRECGPAIELDTVVVVIRRNRRRLPAFLRCLIVVERVEIESGTLSGNEIPVVAKLVCVAAAKVEARRDRRSRPNTR